MPKTTLDARDMRSMHRLSLRSDGDFKRRDSKLAPIPEVSIRSNSDSFVFKFGERGMLLLENELSDGRRKQIKIAKCGELVTSFSSFGHGMGRKEASKMTDANSEEAINSPGVDQTIPSIFVTRPCDSNDTHKGLEVLCTFKYFPDCCRFLVKISRAGMAEKEVVSGIKMRLHAKVSVMPSIAASRRQHVKDHGDTHWSRDDPACFVFQLGTLLQKTLLIKVTERRGLFRRCRLLCVWPIYLGDCDLLQENVERKILSLNQ